MRGTDASRRPRPARRWLRTLVVGAVLGVAGLVVPNSAVNSTEVALVRLDRATGVDLHPHVVWILAVGSDARPGEDMTRSRGDALQLVGLNTRTGAATSIGVPRDSWVDIPGHGHEKINSSLYFGGPELLGRTVGDLVGIHPDYVFVTRFKFFQAMVDDIGGIQVRNPVAFDDVNLKPKGFRRGLIHLNGYDAMAFSRIRHNLLRGDFDRSANQQRVLRGIQAKVRERADRPGFLEKGVLSVMAHLYTNLSPVELFRLAQVVAHVDPHKITGCVVQGGIGDIGGASVVLPDVSMARRLGDEARKDATIEYC